MPQRRELKPYKRSEIIGQYKARVPLKAISRNLGVSRPTIQYTVKQSEKRGPEQHNLPGRGQPRKTTQDQDDRLYQHLRINNNLRWSEIEELTSIKRTQIRQRMQEIDLKFRQYRRQWSQYLSPTNIRERYKYSRDYGSWNPKDWANVWYTDECSVEIGKGGGREWVWRHSGEAWAPDFRAIGSQNHDTIMIWAAMRANGRIVYRIVRDFYEGGTTQTTKVYRRLLEDVIPEIYEPGQAWLQDNAPMHTAHIIRDWLLENGVWWLPHPAKGPDLNPIEHFWLKLKELLYKLHPELLTMKGGVERRKDALVEAIHHIMAEINGFDQWDLPAKLIASMPRRLAAVRLVKGRQTKY